MCKRHLKVSRAQYAGMFDVVQSARFLSFLAEYSIVHNLKFLQLPLEA
jgi:hypothetical protein